MGWFGKSLRSASGTAILEYPLILGFIAVVCFICLGQLSGAINGTLERADNSFTGENGAGGLGAGGSAGGAGPGTTGSTDPPPALPGGSGPGGGNCFLAGTMIAMADGSLKAIELIRVNDLVRSYSEEHDRFEAHRVVHTFEHPHTRGYEILNGRLKVTANHSFLSQGRWTQLRNLKLGDVLTGGDGQVYPISKIVHVSRAVTTYNFEVETTHTYIAGGYVVHNARKAE
ncbi:MAG: hypothetical protein K1X83_04050 [Oligoflexia bacterium]|nr:hypothetical protein [Oligoflexia bacterium]